MRAINFKKIALAASLLVSGLVGALTTASAAEFNIFPVTQVWRYMAETNPASCLDGTGWETTLYDDSAWLSGPGGFSANETSAATVTSLAGLISNTNLPAPPGGAGAPEYFRTHFNIADTTGLFLVLSNRVDDNAVFYINGTRVASVRYTANPEVCTTFGTGGGEATVWEVVTLTPAQLSGILIAGDNVLAVSVHQNSTNSSDAVFVCILTGVVNPPPPPPPITFTNMAGPITFDTAPPVQQWSTRAWTGGNNTTTDTAVTVDANVQTNVASAINVGLGSVAGNPPGTGGAARYASDPAALYIITRPTGTLGDLLMATLTNQSGAAIGGVTLTYDLRVAVAGVEEVPGHLVYYSLTGAAGDWKQIPELSAQPSDNVAGLQTKSAIVTFTSAWADNSTIYFLWADDNSGGLDQDCQIDNVKWSLPAPPTISSCTGLVAQTVLQCRNSTTLSVVGQGGNYQWTLNGTDIPGATSSSYTVTDMQPAKVGLYGVRIFNGLGSTNCPGVQIDIQLDTVPPTLVYALGNTNLYTITVVFSEPVDTNTPSLGDLPFNWALTDTNTGTAVTITNVLVSANDTTFTLETELRDPTHGYTLTLQAGGVQDRCAANAIPETVAIVATFEDCVIANDAVTFWKYDESGTDLGTAWQATGFDDSAWLSGAGTFDGKRTNAASPLPLCRPLLPNGEVIRTCLTLSNALSSAQLPTYYFRTHFTYSGATSGVLLRLQTLLDDGAVFYLNGTEFFRLGMPAGAIAYTTLANRTPGDAVLEQNDAYVANLVNGDNVIAVETHQSSITSSDITFGLKLLTVSGKPGLVRPRLTIVLNLDGSVTVSWNGGGTLICSNDPTLPRASWTAVAGAVSPHTFAAGTLAAYQFYAVRVP